MTRQDGGGSNIAYGKAAGCPRYSYNPVKLARPANDKKDNISQTTVMQIPTCGNNATGDSTLVKLCGGTGVSGAYRSIGL